MFEKSASGCWRGHRRGALLWHLLLQVSVIRGSFDASSALSQEKAFGRKQGVTVALREDAGPAAAAPAKFNAFPAEFKGAGYAPPLGGMHTMALPPRTAGPYKVAIVLLQMGPLPPFALLALTSPPLIPIAAAASTSSSMSDAVENIDFRLMNVSLSSLSRRC